MAGCKRLIEATNAGHYFAECACGWRGGVHLGRTRAVDAWLAHRDGLAPVEPVRPLVLFGPRPRGQAEAGDPRD
jgi:hypothetical protein